MGQCIPYKVDPRVLWLHRRLTIRHSVVSSLPKAAAGGRCSGRQQDELRKYRAVLLPFKSDAVEQTEDAAVFLVSPNTRQRQRRQTRESRARRSASPGRLAALGLRRAASAPACPGPRAYGDSEGSQALRTTVSDEDTFSATQEALDTGIKRRATEQLMVAHLKQFVCKQRLRYGPGDSPMRRRQEVASAAAGFSELYGRTLHILEQNMTLRPPCRHHTFTGADCRLYDLTPSHSRSPGKGGSGRRASSAGPAGLPGRAAPEVARMVDF